MPTYIPETDASTEAVAEKQRKIQRQQDKRDAAKP
jgi:hypothetical protein